MIGTFDFYKKGKFHSESDTISVTEKSISPIGFAGTNQMSFNKTYYVLGKMATCHFRGTE